MSEVVEYVVLTPNDLEDVFDLLTKHYITRENLIVGAGLNPVVSEGLTGKAIRASLASGLSIGARDQATGRLVAFNTNTTRTAPPKHTPAVDCDPFAKSFKIHEMCWEMVDVFQDPGVVRIQEIERVCVHPDYGRRGICKEVIQMSLALGSKHDCQLARIEVTSPYSEKACINLGFETRFTLDLHTLEDGMFDLSLMTYKATKVMTKRLPPKTT